MLIVLYRLDLRLMSRIVVTYHDASLMDIDNLLYDITSRTNISTALSHQSSMIRVAMLYTYHVNQVVRV
jgi:hypothetical protein